MALSLSVLFAFSLMRLILLGALFLSAYRLTNSSWFLLLLGYQRDTTLQRSKERNAGKSVDDMLLVGEVKASLARYTPKAPIISIPCAKPSSG